MTMIEQLHEMYHKHAIPERDQVTGFFISHDDFRLLMRELWSMSPCLVDVDQASPEWSCVRLFGVEVKEADMPSGTIVVESAKPEPLPFQTEPFPWQSEYLCTPYEPLDQ